MNYNNRNEQDTDALDAVIVVRLPHQLRLALRTRAAQEDRRVASLLRLAARAYLEHNEEEL